MNPIDVGVFNKLTGAAGLTTLLSAGTAGVFQHLAPQNEDAPYVVYGKQSGTPRYSYGGTVWEDCLYLVKGVAEGMSAAAAGTIFKQIDLALNDQTLTITGYTNHYCRRASDVDYVETLPGGGRAHHRGALYRIYADPT